MNISGANANKSKYYWKENFENFEDQEAKNYHFGVTQYPFNLVLYDTLMEELIKKNLPNQKPLKILDAGGGTGKWSIYFAKLGHDVTLLDVAKPMLKVAEDTIRKENLNDRITINHGTIVDLPYEDNSFNLIFSDRNPISHCGKKEDSYKSISELYRVLKKDGTMIGCVLNRARKIAQIIMELKLDGALSLFKEGDMERGDGQYSHYFFLDELKEVLTNTGFTLGRIFPTTALAEFIPTVWLLDELPLEKLVKLEKLARENDEFINYGVRFHFIVNKK